MTIGDLSSISLSVAGYGFGVERLLLISAAALVVWGVCCLLMMLFASRLPERAAAAGRRVPAVLRHRRARPAPVPEVPRRAKVALLIAVVWVVSPIDLLPEFLPVIGPLDDVVAVILLLRFAARSIPRETLLAAWPTDPALLERILGRDRAGAEADTVRRDGAATHTVPHIPDRLMQRGPPDAGVETVTREPPHDAVAFVIGTVPALGAG